MPQPCDPNARVWYLRYAINWRPEDADFTLAFGLVDQLSTDLRAWPHEP